MDWIVVGTGRLGSALVQWLHGARTPLRAAVSHAQLAAWLKRLPREQPAVLFLAAPDDALPALARRLAAARSDWRGWCVLHGSGTRAASVLDPLARRGASIASIHPMMTITRRTPSPCGVVFSIEGDPVAIRTARAQIRQWGGQALLLTPQAKAAYHLAATLVGPGAVVNFAAAEAILIRARLSGSRLRTARTGLVQLLRATAANLEQGTTTAWTGPWARGDRATIALQYRRMPTKALRNLYVGLTAASTLVTTGSKKKRFAPKQ